MKNLENEKKMKESTTRVILNVPNEIDAQFKELGIKRGIPKSSMIIYAMSWYLDYNKSLEVMPKILDLYKNTLNDYKKDNESNK